MIRFGRYFWKLFFVNAALMALILVVGLWVITLQFDQFYESELTDHLRARAITLQKTVQDVFDEDHFESLNTLAKEIGTTELEGVRITFILADGTVVGDSKAEASRMESHANRPEVIHAMAEGYGESTRWSHTLSKNLKYVAVRVGTAENPKGAIRIAMTLEGIIARTRSARTLLSTIAAISILATILLALGIALLWSRPIQRITQVADQLSRGNLSTPVQVSGHDEVSLLGQSLDRMRRRLARQIDTIEHHSLMTDALISQLKEGVMVTDANERIVLANHKALQLMNIDPVNDPIKIMGQPVEKIIHHHELLTLLTRSTMNSGDLSTTKTDHEGEIEFRIDTSSGTRVILARGSSIQLPTQPTPQATVEQPVQTGRVVILSDITERTRIQQMKTDLAANASHELRTPIAAIRASIETLETLHSQDDSERVEQCIDIIDRQSTRMDALLSDLLNLSRIESASHTFKREDISVRDLITELHDHGTQSLQQKDLQWQQDFSHSVTTVSVNRELLFLVLTNLLDNAIRFTASGGTVGVKTDQDDHSITISVFDTGCGIAPEDQHRVFERFYQVESSRSGPDRGTGLGLSIVRHAANALGMEVILESKINEGTTVKVIIPTL